MANLAYSSGAAFKTQAVAGTPETWAGGTYTEADGFVPGDPESGQGDGITLNLERILREKAVVGASFTRPISDYIRTDVSMTFAFPLKGNGATATPTLGQAIPRAGVHAIMRATGLVGANGDSGAAYKYTPTAAGIAGSTLMTCKVWIAGTYVTISDATVSTWSLSQTPSESGVLTCTIAGTLAAVGEEAFPTITYAAAWANLSAPVVKSVGHVFGTAGGAGAIRGFSDGAVTIENSNEETGDSNSTSGITSRQTDRVVTFSGTIYTDDGNKDQMLTELSRTSAGILEHDQSWTVGTPAGAAAIINAYKLQMATQEITASEPVKVGNLYASTVTAIARQTVANTEFRIDFL